MWPKIRGGAGPSQSTTVSVGSAPAKPAAINGNASVCSDASASYTVGGVSGATSYAWALLGGTILSGQGTAGVTAQLTSQGTLSVSAVNGCGTGPALGKDIAVTPRPTAYPVTGGGSFCTGSTGVSVYLDNSQAGVSYQVYRDGIQYGSSITGIGYGMNLLASTAVTGSFTAIGTYAATGCSTPMSGSATVSALAAPTPTLGTTTTTVCSGSAVTFTADPGGGPAIASYGFYVNATAVQKTRLPRISLPTRMLLPLLPEQPAAAPLKATG